MFVAQVKQGNVFDDEHVCESFMVSCALLSGGFCVSLVTMLILGMDLSMYRIILVYIQCFLFDGSGDFFNFFFIVDLVTGNKPAQFHSPINLPIFHRPL